MASGLFALKQMKKSCGFAKAYIWGNKERKLKYNNNFSNPTKKTLRTMRKLKNRRLSWNPFSLFEDPDQGYTIYIVGTLTYVKQYAAPQNNRLLSF